ncbi:MAG: glycosyltransferase family 2 protein [Nitrososphaerota archaeon]|nr:glycosyltransferase family 2 protein [Nitrososphaerota archaeon]
MADPQLTGQASNSPSNSFPLVSVIIPTYNSARSLERCLSSINLQSLSDLEVIVVDNYSRDDTCGIAKRCNARLYSLAAERSAAKNFGIMKSKGKYILFIDADMELSNRVVEECLDYAERSREVEGVVIPERSVGGGFWVRVRDFERSFYAGTKIESPRFFRRDLVLRAGGYDESVVFYEESTLPQRIEKMGYVSRPRIKSEILHHEEEFSIVSWLRKKYYYGKSAAKYRSLYREYGITQMSFPYRLSLYIRVRRFYSGGLLAGGLLALKALEYCAAGMGYLAGPTKFNT